jgi:putative acetyltransferase
VNATAFETPVEANLVDALRQQARPVVSLVAEDNQTVVGHIMFSPMTVEPAAIRALALGPVAVDPGVQNRGIGGELIRAGILRAET